MFSHPRLAALAACLAVAGASPGFAAPVAPGNVVVTAVHRTPFRIRPLLGQEFAVLTDGLRVQTVFAPGDDWIVCNSAAGAAEAICSTMPANDWWSTETMGGWGPPGQVLAYYPQTLERYAENWGRFQHLQVIWPVLSTPWQGPGEWTSCFGMRVAKEFVPSVTAGGAGALEQAG
jgi:hypothetical protein